jgi:hypothetical protein
LCQKIIAAQSFEIEMMQPWLEAVQSWTILKVAKGTAPIMNAGIHEKK